MGWSNSRKNCGYNSQTVIGGKAFQLTSNIKKFRYAYDDFEKAIAKYAVQNIKILEIGSGASPCVNNHEKLNYTVIDPDKEELNKSNVQNKIHANLEGWETNQKFDLIVSRMVLEHIPNPTSFHKKVLDLLSENGKAIHLYACRNSIPALFNRFLPESLGDHILRLIKNRNLDEEPKYPAFYRMTNGPIKRDINFYTNLGFQIRFFIGYVGHNYFHAIPVIRFCENLYSSILGILKIKRLSTVSVLILEKLK